MDQSTEYKFLFSRNNSHLVRVKDTKPHLPWGKITASCGIEKSHHNEGDEVPQYI